METRMPHQNDLAEIINPSIFKTPYYYYYRLLKRAYEKLINKHLTSSKVYKIADYGCGVMPYKYIFRSLNSENQYVGIDVGDNPDAEVIIKENDILPLENNSFDVVMSTQVIEHVDNLEQYMKECYRIIKPGGLFLLSAPATWQYHLSPIDVQRWTSYGIKKLITDYKFKVIDFEHILGQLAATSQLRLSFYYSAANFLGVIGKIILLPVSIFYQFKMMIEDFITPQRVKERDSAIFVVLARKEI